MLATVAEQAPAPPLPLIPLWPLRHAPLPSNQGHSLREATSTATSRRKLAVLEE